MSDIETIICLILVFMVVPDVCRKLGRPSLTYPVFVLLGIALTSFIDAGTGSMLKQAGRVGFLLLLFEVGLEIELPKFRDILGPAKYAASWALAQYPIILGLVWLMGLGVMEGLVAAAALTGCSVGMGYPAWKSYPSLQEPTRSFVLQVMVLLEMAAIVLLAGETVALKSGVGWLLVAKLIGVATMIYLISRFATRIGQLLQMILKNTTQWRMHLVVLLVLGVCALGERLGLSAAKTAFFLGLFMSRLEHDGVGVAEYLAPISQRFLIPIFFVALGLEVPWRTLSLLQMGVMLSTVVLLLGWREVMHRRWLPVGGDKRSFLLLCPNLTMVGLAANAMLEKGQGSEGAAWLVLTGLCMTVTALFLLPRKTSDEVEKAIEQEIATVEAAPEPVGAELVGE